jgi:hypothetical protein
MRVALGVAVFSGMLGVTIFGIFFTPVFYVVIRWLTESQGLSAIFSKAHALFSRPKPPVARATQPGASHSADGAEEPTPSKV